MANFHDRVGLGAVFGNLASPATTALTGTGIWNSAALGTTATKVASGDASKGGKQRRCKIVCVTASRNVAWGIAPLNASTVSFKADGDGSSDEGSLIVGGGGATEWVTIPATHDFYLVASAAATAVQVTMVEI